MKVRIRLYGELALKHGTEIELNVENGTTVRDILKMLRISDSEHHLIVNERRVQKSHALRDGDILKVLPVVYGGYPSPNPTSSPKVSVR